MLQKTEIEWRKYIEFRVDYLTSPHNLARGFVTYREAYERLSELMLFVEFVGLPELREEIRMARLPFERKIQRDPHL